MPRSRVCTMRLLQMILVRRLSSTSASRLVEHAVVAELVDKVVAGCGELVVNLLDGRRTRRLVVVMRRRHDQPVPLRECPDNRDDATRVTRMMQPH
eukprot:5432716-Pleurochrysis_carterae.AAC.1